MLCSASTVARAAALLTAASSLITLQGCAMPPSSSCTSACPDGAAGATDAPGPGSDGAALDAPSSAQGCDAGLPVVRFAINAGGAAAGGFVADENASGGMPYRGTDAVDTGGVANAAPAAVYQSYRYGLTAPFTYAFGGLTAGAPYTLRLHFAEIYQHAAGVRLFDVAVNGAAVLSRFDVFAAAGGADRALVREFAVRADDHGAIAAVFSPIAGFDSAMVNGLELVSPPPADCAAPPDASFVADAATDAGPVDADAGGPCVGVAVSPGATTVQDAAAAHGPHTTFCLQPGTYPVRATVHVQEAQVFRAAAPGVVFDGGGALDVAFAGAGASFVQIVGIEFRNFHTSVAYQSPGVIRGANGTDWLVADNYIHDCNGSGVEFYSSNGADTSTGLNHSTFLNNRLNNLGYAGTRVGLCSYVTVDSNEISNCNLTNSDTGDDVAALGKWALTDHAVVRNNYVHDNHCAGLWFDISNYAAEIYANRVENNNEGIMWEISFEASIHDNTVRGNGVHHGNIYEGGGGIRISSSGGRDAAIVDVYNNTLEGNGHGITVYQQRRGGMPGMAQWISRNVHVHGNHVSGSTGEAAALDQDTVIGPGIYANGNTFDGNAYELLPTNPQSFEYNGLTNWSGWHGHGEDATGACTVMGGGACP